MPIIRNGNEILVNGVLISLTRQQLKKINTEIAERKEDKSAFEKVLFHYQFKKVDTTGWLNPKQDCYQHVYFNWWAEIVRHGGWHEVWLVGEGLKCGGFPGGWNYGEPEYLQEEIEKAIQILINE